MPLIRAGRGGGYHLGCSVPGINCRGLPVARARASPGGHVTVDQSPAVLRDVSLKIKAGSSGASELEFEGTARGDSFERMTLSGSINLQTGILDLRGELSGLVLSESLRRKLPAGCSTGRKGPVAQRRCDRSRRASFSLRSRRGSGTPQAIQHDGPDSRRRVGLPQSAVPDQ